MVVLTPAEELGLSGLHLDGRVRKAFYAMPSRDDRRAFAADDRRSRASGTALSARRRAEVIHIMLRPIARDARPVGLSELRLADDSQRAQAAARPVPAGLRRARRSCRSTPPRRQWLWDSWGPSHRENNPVFGRLDAVVEFTSPMWKDSLRFMEPNLCGVGGLHLVPTCEQLLADVVLPVIQQSDPRAAAWRSARISARSSSRKCSTTCKPSAAAGRTSASSSPSTPARGPTSRKSLAQYYHERHGLKIMHADPRELSIADGEVCYEGTVVDIAYRDYEVRDLIRTGTRRGRRRRADAHAVSREPHDLVDGRRVRPQELLGDADRPQFTQQVLHGRGAADLPPPHAVDARAGAIAARRCPTARRATCWSSSARSTSCWCSSRTARTAATGW